ncbi:hypothetical protein Back11_14950 [Paenibacillus baekrokdamisoli]|uniref:Uncharacterized protein n=1 Tax=Paenibacillus baekrokdamisoli TaxID=1712516 RepID=A0A3G9IMS9_9BACL|nr:hypothetical protein [Paenibacillus baekrokdamisoli]MBB3072760.1 hypothetical protein [Paenibacillus baekrokdamisoli]BBH20150.1 hypothetical protein Back11_14950 [Paenibacillus baekrokdamisoli]
MPDYTVNDQSHQDSHSYYESTLPINKVSRQTVISIGVNALDAVGSSHICKVCIANGGSCCNGCRHLANGIGCQQRNTSCTAWLCGFLKYLLYETGLLKEWNEFWDQVPGQSYREDFTPEFFFAEKSLHLQDLRKLSEALAADLQVLARSHIAIGFILTLREKIDKNIDQLDNYEHDPKKKIKIQRNIKILSSPFHRFQKELQDYNKA